MVRGRLSVLCELRSKRVVYLRLVIFRAVRDVGRARAVRVHHVLCETGKNGAETFEMLRTAFGEQCLSRARIFEWRAKCGQKSKSCSLFSLIWRALFIMSTFHKAKL